MPDSPRNSSILLTHAVFAGLTPLIPVPFVDDLFYSYFLRSMANRLAESHQKSLNSAEIGVLTAPENRGCALGCIGSVLLYPLKKLLSKVFYFLEWKRAADTISATYYLGFLLDAALEANWIQDYGAAPVRAAIERVLSRTNTSLVSRAALGVIGQSRQIVKNLVRQLVQTLPHAQKPGENDIAQAADAAQNEETDGLGGLISQLQAAIAGLPAEHFAQLRRELASELGVAAKS